MPGPFGRIDVAESVLNRREARAEFAGELFMREGNEGLEHTVASPIVIVEKSAQILKIQKWFEAS